MLLELSVSYTHLKTYEDLDKIVELGLMKKEGGSLFSNLNLDRSGEIYLVADMNDYEGLRMLGYNLAGTLRGAKVKEAHLKCMNPNPVSYTHLDVYKRQPWWNPSTKKQNFAIILLSVLP